MYIWLLKYGFNYEHVYIEGLYSSRKLGEEARNKCMCIESGYDYYTLVKYKVDT